MEFIANSINQLPQQSNCLIVAVFTQNELSTIAEELDKASQGAIRAFLAHGDLSGKIGETALLYKVNGINADRILLVGCGDKKGISDQEFYKLLRSIASNLKQTKTTQAIYALTDLNIKEQNINWQLRQAVIILRDELYSFTQLKSKSESNAENFKQLDLLTTNDQAAQKAVATGSIIADSVKLAKDLAYLPPNICTPTYLAEQAQQVAKEIPSLKIEIIEEEQMRELKMGSLLAVTQGSQQPAKLVILHYEGANASSNPTILVGKGITFDTGGINLKPSTGILGMKFDMCGAATVLASIRAAALLKLPLNIIAVMVCVENMIGSHAYRPDDVVTSMSGQTIEVTNTDAEGRLILCDALTYCTRFKPEVVIDMATLTGAIITALGKHASGVFSNNQPLADALLKAGQESGDRAWQLPIWDEYQSQLDSGVADMVNSGASGANSITAACFLSRFTKEYKWAHLDIAGTAFQLGSKAVATGRPVPLIVQYLIDQASSNPH
ncbi:MAG: leucyl aminopeptidase [Gammaproteobacteria bacterium]